VTKLRKVLLYIVIMILAVSLHSRQWNKTQYFIDCGLNYVHKSIKITNRDSILPGNELPVKFDIFELPGDCFRIKAAYLWWTVSYRNPVDSLPVVTITNPEDSILSVKARLIGSDIGKCWLDFNEKGTRAYKADISNAIAGNGSYKIDISQPEEEIDGLTLLIIYSDLKADYQGNMFLSDGLITMQRKDTNVVLNEISVCDTAIAGTTQAFIVLSDLQANKTDTNSKVVLDNVSHTFKRRFWNSEIFDIDKAIPGKDKLDFKIETEDDCYSIVMNGIYFRTGEKCKICPERVKVSIKANKLEVCEGTVVTLSASGASKYEWSDRYSEFSNDSIIYVLPPAGGMLYTVNATTEDGCHEGTDKIFIAVNEKPRAYAGEDVVFCKGDYVKIGMPQQKDFQYLWRPSTGLNNPSIPNPLASPDSTTTYILTASSKYGCFNFDTVVVTVSPELKIEHTDTIFSCPGKPVSLDTKPSEGTKPYKFNWQPAKLFNDPAEPVQDISLFNSQRFFVTVTDSKGCSVIDTIDVVINSDIKASAGTDKLICQGGSTIIGESITGGKPPYQVLWKPDDGLSSTSILQPLALPATTTNYYLSIIDSEGCYAFDTVRVFVNDSIITTYTDTIYACSGSKEIITGSVAGGKKPYKYSWNPAEGLSSSDVANPEVTVDKSIKYYLTVTDSANCPVVDSILIEAREKSVFELGSDVVMCQNSEIKIGSDVSKGLPPYNIRWYPSDGLDRTDTSFVIASPISTTMYFLEVTDSFGCKSLDSITVEVLATPNPVISANGNTEICLCDSILLSCIGNYNSYYWPDGSRTQSIYSKLPGKYFVNVIDSNGCSGISNVIEVKTYTPQVNLIVPDTLNVETGDEFNLPLSISFDDNLINCGRYNYTGKLSFNKTVLLPTGDTPIGITDDKNRIIPFNGTIDINNKIQREFHFISALGNSSNTDISIIDFSIVGCDFEIKHAKTKLNITDICTTGNAPRLLVNENKPLMVSFHPIPATQILNLDIVAVSDGTLDIEVRNMIGITAIERSYSVKAGKSDISLDLSGLEPGLYFICTRKSFDDSCRKLLIIK
jgi:hypothetical protein